MWRPEERDERESIAIKTAIALAGYITLIDTED
jgi:hypothetical protein